MPIRDIPSSFHSSCFYEKSNSVESLSDITSLESLSLSAFQNSGEKYIKHLDGAIADAMSSLSPKGKRIAETLCDITENGPNQALKNTEKDTLERGLAESAKIYLENVEEVQNGIPLTNHERCILMLNFLKRIMENDFDKNFERWASNILNVSLRTGFIVGFTTIFRQLIGFYIEKALFLGDVPMPMRKIIGAVSMFIGPGLNIIGLVRDELNNTSTKESRIARVSMLALSISSFLIVYQTGEPSVLASLMSSMGLQALSYTLARDLAQLFITLENNADINISGTVTGGLIYNCMQFGSGEISNILSPSSGASRVINEEKKNTKLDTENINNLRPDLPQDVYRGVLNAAVEVSDDLIRPYINRKLQVRKTKSDARDEAIAKGKDPILAIDELPQEYVEGLRIKLGIRKPDWTNFFDQFFTTSAMRTSSLQTVMGVVMSAATILEKTSLSTFNQGHILNAITAGVISLNYIPFVHAHENCSYNNPQKDEQIINPEIVFQKRRFTYNIS